MAQDEQQLIREILEGRTEAFSQLVSRYGGALTGFVASFVSQQADVDEVVQQSFVAAFEHLSRFDARRASFQTWLWRIARNTALKHLKSRQRFTLFSDLAPQSLFPHSIPESPLSSSEFPPSSSESHSSSSEFPPSSSEFPPSSSESPLYSPASPSSCSALGGFPAEPSPSDAPTSRLSHLEAAIDRLPPADQQLLHLYYTEERPLADIAYILETNANALGSRLYRIRQRLAQLINHLEHETD